MYEAAALALKAFGQKARIHGPSRNTELEVAVDVPPPVKVTVGAVLDWLYYKPAKSAVEKERKDRLRALLLEERRCLAVPILAKRTGRRIPAIGRHRSMLPCSR